MIALVSILGVSYANWLFTSRQKDFNTLGSKCFELTMMNESEGITLDKTYPISDEEVYLQQDIPLQSKVIPMQLMK